MSLPLRLGLFYAALYVGTGASSPYMPVWFKQHGLTGAEIGLILALPMLARVFTAPMLAVWADGFRLRRTPMILLAGACAALNAALAAPFGFWWWATIWFAGTTLFVAITPLTDVITLTRARRDGFNYGWPRGIGSAAFIVANVGAGALLAVTSPDLILWWIVASAALAALGARYLLPDDPIHAEGDAPTRSDRWAGLGQLLKDRSFMVVVLSAGLIQSAHAFYYSFSTLTWRQQGIPESMTGVLWGVAVGVEVVFMWFFEPWRRRVGPRNLLILGGAGATVRWIIYMFSPPLWMLFPLQALHTLSFSATFLASLQLVERLAPARSASAAQSINSALSGGLLMGLATLASGWIFDRFGAGGYGLMAAMSGLGLILGLTLYREQRLEDRA